MTDQIPPDDHVLQVRRDLMAAVAHYADVASQHGAGALQGPRAVVNTAGAAALQAAAYGYVLAALLGQMAASSRLWTGPDAAAFVEQLLDSHGVHADFNHDVMPDRVQTAPRVIQIGPDGPREDT